MIHLPKRLAERKANPRNFSGSGRGHGELAQEAERALRDVRITAPPLPDHQHRELDRLIDRYLRCKLTDADRALIAESPPVQDLLMIVTCVAAPGWKGGEACPH